MKRLLVLLLPLLLFFPACRRQDVHLPLEGLTGEDLRQTMEAMPPSGSVPSPYSTQGAEQAGSLTATVGSSFSVLLTPQVSQTPPPGMIAYTARSGDTLAGLAGRFGVEPEEIISPLPIPQTGYLIHDQPVFIPDVLGWVTPPDLLLPDSEMIYSPSAVGFDVAGFIQQAGGFLSRYIEVVQGETLNGAQIVQRAADELSVNPRLLLAFLEYRSHWVFGEPASGASLDYPIGFEIDRREGLYQELVITATQLNMVYYGWRKGNYTLIDFPDKVVRRLNPRLNAATASLQNLMAIFYRESEWYQRLYGEKSFPQLYADLFGDPMERAAQVEPLLPADLTQPPLELPFPPGETWRFSAGPHYSWNFGTPRGALDFSPPDKVELCTVSTRWATASAPGLVVRAAHNAVVIDLDEDGFEQTGWALVYFHIAEEGMISQGQKVALDEPLGHPSCEGGQATASHVHLARKYNGEWLPADETLPFILSGYRVVAGQQNYQGFLIKDGVVIPSNAYGSPTSLVKR